MVIDSNKVSLGSLFFDLETLNNIEENLLKVSKDKEQKLKNFEKLRTVGKGAFGAAILYRKKDDGLMVIIKVWHNSNPHSLYHDQYFCSLGNKYARFVGD